MMIEAAHGKKTTSLGCQGHLGSDSSAEAGHFALTWPKNTTERTVMKALLNEHGIRLQLNR